MNKNTGILLIVFFIHLVAHAQEGLVPQTGHSGSYCMALSEDDSRLLTAGVDGRIMLWDVGATKALKNFRPYNTSIYCAAWKYDGSFFAVGTADSVIAVFDASTCKEIKRFKLPFIPVELCFHPKENVLAVGGSNGAIKVVDASGGSVYFGFQPDRYVTGLSFSQNGALLFASGWEHGVNAYDMDQGKTMLNIPLTAGNHCSGMCLSHNNQFLFVYLENGTTEIVDLFQNKKVGSLNNSPLERSGGVTYYFDPVLTADNAFMLSVDTANHLLITDQKTGNAQVYNNTFSSSDINNIVPANRGGFFVLSTLSGSMSCVYFNGELFNRSSPLMWRKLQASPERIYQLDFLDHDETLAMTGNGYYQLNLVTGDMHRRDQDSAVVSDREYTTRYFTVDPNNAVYYAADLLRKTGFEIRKDTTVPLQGIAFSADTNTVAFLNQQQELIIYDLRQKKKTVKPALKGQTGFVLFNNTFNHLFITRSDQGLQFLDHEGTLVQTLGPLSNAKVNSICASTVTQRVFLLSEDQHITAFDFRTGKEITLAAGLSGVKAQMMDVTADGKKMAVLSDGKLNIYNPEDGSISSSIDLRDEALYSFGFNNKGNQLALAMENGLVQLWNVDQAQKLVSILCTPQEGMLVYTDEYDYMATREAARQLVFVKENKPVSLSNVEMVHNRPDKVLQKIGMSDERLLNAYGFAYERRLKKKGSISPNGMTEIPEVSLMNQTGIPASTSTEKLLLKIGAKSNSKKINSLHVWINNVPVYGRNGILLSPKNNIEKEIVLNLVAGTNHIKFSAIDEAGAESEKEEIIVVNTQNRKPDLYLLSIGTSKYQNKAFDLTYAAKDAGDLTALFGSLKGENSPYNKVICKTMVNEEVTKTNLEKARVFLEQARTDDVVMVFVAGHGVRDEQMQYFFGTYDMNFEQPAEKGFSEENFARMVDGIKAVKRLIFFDTCLSGELDRDEAEHLTASNTVIKAGEVSFRSAGAGIRTHTSGLYNASALMREIYNDLDEGTGSTIISSAGGAEYAMESSEWKNGLFTYCFLNGLKNYAADNNTDREITVSELQDYIRKEVVRLSKGKQQPSFKKENMIMNYRIW